MKMIFSQILIKFSLTQPKLMDLFHTQTTTCEEDSVTRYDIAGLNSAF